MRGGGPVVEVDTALLWSAIGRRLVRVPTRSAKEVALLLGFSPQVFSDIKAAANGGGPYQPGSPVLLSICWWLGADPRDFQRQVRPVYADMGARDADTDGDTGRGVRRGGAT